ncbi:serine/threonine-protein phosphatase [Streptomyces luteoverticillatus]|uniref:Serine/threonine-protein phosphatase n=1 Tax=Streptomyces luteoverticillatus TaxID=66425 RepID=A0A3Q9FZY5_STRLT|nr:PP2C family protein-serine/threonine phosphatase [Streptomyces luteoverticillatus]AZQ74606.1 serine/threonine-protein phosphatase [Streptomyces luteoverticillatus]
MRLQHRLPDPGESWRPSRALIAVPLGLIGLIVTVDLLTAPNIHLGPLLVVAPTITAVFAGPRLTALIGALAVAAQIVIGLFHGGLWTSNHQAQIIALVVITLFVVAFRSVHERHRMELSQARWVADVAQKVLLRPLPARLGPLRIASVYVAAEAGAQIGGDLYAAVRTPRGARVMIGDVRGKGLMAVGDAALLLGAYRAAAHRDPPLPRLVAHLQNAVYSESEGTDEPEGSEEPGWPTGDTSAGERFVTAAVLDIPDDEQVLRIINCGHPPPILLRDGEPTELTVRDPALPLGVGGSVTEDDYEAETFPYRDGDLLLLYTDGVVETRDADGVFYPLADRLRAWRETDPQRLVQRLHGDLVVHAGGSLGDDVALVAIARHPAGTTGRDVSSPPSPPPGARTPPSARRRGGPPSQGS